MLRTFLPIPSEYEVALEDKRKCTVPISENFPNCDNHSDTFSDSKIDDDISVYEESFEDIEYVEASLLDPEIVSIEEDNGVEEENVVQREEEEVDLEDISQVQDVVLCEKLFRITRLISNIESLNDNSTPDCVFNSFESDNSLLDNFSPEFETFCDHTEETRSGNTTHANHSLPEYNSFCFEIEPDQERLINLVGNNNSDSSNDPLLEEVDLSLFDDLIPPGIENFADDPEGDIRFLEELLIDDSILSHESFDSSFEDNPSISRPPPEPPDYNFDLEPEVISAVMEDIDEPDEHFNPGGEIFVSTNNEDVDYFPFMFVIQIFFPYLILPEISPLFRSTESEDMIFDPVFYLVCACLCCDLSRITPRSLLKSQGFPSQNKTPGPWSAHIPMWQLFKRIGVIRFGKRGKLNPIYIRPFKVLEKVGFIAYKLELPQELSRVHNTFHVSNLKKCYADEPLAVPLDRLHVDDKLQFVEERVEIIDREVKWLKRSCVPIVKVRWNSIRGHEFTWEREDQFRKKYPHLFTKTALSSSVTS
uniref:Putative reverse transcriptase domain-containing protein n=1 Tax=Tanacetum cinerariifolium TaxID=118510 RepID=A0A6L2N5P3_TANCI|nr:putative reverse transcriptase domain-containing protein [Tanacetum cinerariifolium]